MLLCLANIRSSFMQKNNHYYIGIMSGTSLDGVDIALMDFNQRPPKLLASHCFSMPENLRQQLTALLKNGEIGLQQLGELDHQLGLLYANSVQRFLAQNQMTADSIQAIGCHGQTIWHSPQGQYPFTMQIGDANLISVLTGITTIADFRRKDMAHGGQGAPLSPAFHQALFAQPDRITVVLNIGGISNISCLIPEQEVIGYDTGVGNALMDSWIEQHLGVPFDQDGEWAKSGSVHQDLLKDLLDEPFFQQLPPKSTGRELFNLAWLNKKLKKHTALSAQDVQATLLEFTVQCTVQELVKLANPNHLPCLLLVCGGGAKNRQLMARLQACLPQWHVATTTEHGLSVDYVEAAAFAWLAYQRINHLPSNLPSVTGAKSAVSLGVIYPK